MIDVYVDKSYPEGSPYFIKKDYQITICRDVCNDLERKKLV